MTHRPILASTVAALALSAAMPAAAETVRDFAVRYDAAARVASPAWAASATRGAAFFRSPQSREWTCATCHTPNPGAAGRHATTGKPIAPLAPSANADRFTDAAKVEKWFKRNCNDVLGRECTSAEKADVIAFLMTAR